LQKSRNSRSPSHSNDPIIERIPQEGGKKGKREGQAPKIKSCPFSSTGENSAQFSNSCTPINGLANLDFEILKSKHNYRSNLLLATLKLPNTSLFNLGNINLTEGESIVLGLGLKFLPKTQCSTMSIKESLSNSVDTLIQRIQRNIFIKDQ